MWRAQGRRVVEQLAHAVLPADTDDELAARSHGEGRHACCGDVVDQDLRRRRPRRLRVRQDLRLAVQPAHADEHVPARAHGDGWHAGSARNVVDERCYLGGGAPNVTERQRVWRAQGRRVVEQLAHAVLPADTDDELAARAHGEGRGIGGGDVVEQHLFLRLPHRIRVVQYLARASSSPAHADQQTIARTHSDGRGAAAARDAANELPFVLVHLLPWCAAAATLDSKDEILL